MKKFVSLLCSIAMLFSLCTVAFAVDVEATEPADVAVMSVNDDGNASPQAESRGLYYAEDVTGFGSVDGTLNWHAVTPDKGANLNVWTKNTGAKITVYVRKGLTVKQRTYNPNDPVNGRDTCFFTNCSGTYYVAVNIEPPDWGTYSILVYQN